MLLDFRAYITAYVPRKIASGGLPGGGNRGGSPGARDSGVRATRLPSPVAVPATDAGPLIMPWYICMIYVCIYLVSHIKFMVASGVAIIFYIKNKINQGVKHVRKIKSGTTQRFSRYWQALETNKRETDCTI